MRLEAWMKKSGVSRLSLANELGMTVGGVTMVLTGKRSFHPTKANKIIELSGGKVTYADLYRNANSIPKQEYTKGKVA
jgi:hypothetical protein